MRSIAALNSVLYQHVGFYHNEFYAKSYSINTLGVTTMRSVAADALRFSCEGANTLFKGDTCEPLSKELCGGENYVHGEISRSNCPR
ncbi:hypothetical protein J6590_017639 [Homalodisca vitripennis]|nr:hypothetical protein J6590_017639 [Homalodisca vitripennis]